MDNRPILLRGVKDLLLSSLDRVRSLYGSIFPLLLVITVAWVGPILASRYFQGQVYGSYQLILGSILLLLVSQAINLSLMSAFKGSEVKKTKTYFKEGINLLWPSLLLACLTSLVVLGGLSLVVIPGIILSLWFAFAPAVLVVEGRRGMSALLRSKELVSGRVLAVLWRIIFISSLVYIGQLLLSFLGQVINGKLLGEVLSSLGNTLLFYPVSTAFFMLLFQDSVTGRPAEGFIYNEKDVRRFTWVAVFGAVVLVFLIVFIGPMVFNSSPPEYRGA